MLLRNPVSLAGMALAIVSLANISFLPPSIKSP
jgi:hypothetical protein